MATTDLIVRLIGDTRGLRKDLSKATGSLNSFKKNISSVGNSLGLAFGGAIVLRAIGTGIRKIADFEEQMDKVAAVSRASSKEIAELTKNALDLGAKSKFTATQIGSMQEVLARLGFSTKQIINTTESVRKLATAAGEELAPAAEIMAGTLNSFNLQANDSERVANIMAEAFSTTALNLERFGAGMSNVGAIAKTTNRTLEFTSAALGTLVDRNIDASKAGTDLRKIFIELAAEGMTFEDAMRQIRESTNKVTTAVSLFGVRAAASAVILAQNEQKVNSLAESYGDLNTEIDSMVATMEDNLNTDLKLMNSAIDGAIQKGSALNGVFRGTIQLLTAMVGGDVKGGFYDVSSLGAEELTDRIKKLNFQFQQNAEKLNRGIISFDEYNAAAEKITKTIEQSEKMLVKFQASSGLAPLPEIPPMPFPEIVIPPGLIKQVSDQLKQAQENAELAFNVTQLSKFNQEIARLKTRLEELNAVGLKRPELPTLDIKRKEATPLSDASTNIASSQADDLEAVRLRLADERNKMEAEQQSLLDSFIGWKEMGETVLAGAAEALALGFQAIGDAIASGEDPLADAGQAILKVFSSLMGQLGSAMIASGVAMLAAQVAMSNPFTSGAGLILAGAALSLLSGAMGAFVSGAQDGVSGGVSSNGSTSFGGSSGSAGNVGLGFENSQAMTVNIVGHIKGQDLVFIQEKANRDRGLRG